MSRPIQAIIHTAALAGNLQVVRRFAPGARVWSVVKANAYGHGVRQVFAALAQTDAFAVLDLDEAAQLRELGWAGPVLLLEGCFSSADLRVAETHHLSVTVHTLEQVRMLEQAALAQPVDVHLKMNTGMNRLGLPVTAYADAWRRLRLLSHVGSIVLMTHFSDADGPRGIAHQLAHFERGVAGLTGSRSLCNSAGVLWHAEAHADHVRPGIMLYGASPSGRVHDLAGTGLQPAMTLASEVIAVQHLDAGDTCGYGSQFVASAALRIGVVACGYADGYPRTAQGAGAHETPVWVDGVRTRMVGRVSMDMICVDLTPCPNAGVGTRVELWGKHLPIDEVASAAGTVGYELMCALSARVPVTID